MSKKWFYLLIPVFLIGIGLGVWGGKLALKSKTVAAEYQSHVEPAPNGEVVDFVESDSNVVDTSSEGYSILLMGKGGDGHSGGYLADSIILIHVDKTNKQAVLISIPRDFWFSGHKINADPSIKDAVTAITGISVDDYINIDFNSFVDVINDIGGIDINIPKAYTDNFYPVRGLENELCGFSPEKVAQLHEDYSGFNLEKQFTCRYETIHFDIGTTHIDGETALKYVRSRHGDGDFGRSERQFFVLKSLLTKNLSVDTLV